MSTRALLPLLLAGCTLTPRGVPVAPPRATIGIGGGEDDAHTHLTFGAGKNMVRASVHVIVDRVPATGMNFFALQVNFTNHTWAHGGLQDVGSKNRKRQVNWGGLLNRGGGSADYDQEDPLADLELIQNPPAGQHVGPWAWKDGVEYEYVVERGAQITLPAGDYHFFPEKPALHVDHDRTMWEWRFTATPIDGSADPFVALLYDSADSFSSFYVWNESGGDAKPEDQHTTWTVPRYRIAGDDTDQAVSSWKRF
jgi:hypothetical protein